MINNEPPYMKYLFAKASQNLVPLCGTFELTSRCNFNCKMCYIHNSDSNELKKKELSTQQWKDIADKAQKAGTLILLITGGEPLLRDDFSEIYIHCKKLGFEISINTNGSLINDEIIELLKRYKPARVNVTLYGASEETYKNITCRSGYYEKVCENILRLKKAGIQVKISITITSYNHADFEQIYKFARENMIPTESTGYMFPSARLGRETDRPNPYEAAKYMVENDKWYFGERFSERKAAFEKIANTNSEKSTDGMPVRCRAGKAAFWVTYDGNMMPCGMMIEPKANIFELGFEESWQKITTETKKIFLPPECTNCEYEELCESCAASCYAETGKFNGLPTYLCQKSKEYVRLSLEEFNK